MPLRQPIDLDHLSRYTGGDEQTNAEILSLFANQSTEILARLEAAFKIGDVKDWREAAHSLKGGARGIGAFHLADSAANVEAVDIAADASSAARVLHDLKSQMLAVTLFIETYLGR